MDDLLPLARHVTASATVLYGLLLLSLLGVWTRDEPDAVLFLRVAGCVVVMLALGIGEVFAVAWAFGG